MVHFDTATPEKPRSVLRTVLQRVLAEECHLAVMTRDYGWRVPGAPVQSIKRLFAEQGRQIDGWMRELRGQARRVGLTGEWNPDGETAAGAAPESTTGIVSALLAQHQKLACELSEAIEALHQKNPNSDAAGFLSGLRDFHETSAWMLNILLSSAETRRVRAIAPKTLPRT